ncbi:MAG: flagellar biosynthetic protein FliO [Rhodanobacteraceae bacterium]
MRFVPCLLALIASPAYAASAPADLDAGGLLRVCLSLGVVIALILCAGYVLRRLQGGTVRSGGNLRALESIAIGMKERVVLVQAGEKQLLLGVAPGSVRTLHVFDEPIALATPNAVTPAAAFKTVLSQWRGAQS